ncbi:MAG: DUF2285 domain-containing protein [Bdellovibrionales bacterium]
MSQPTLNPDVADEAPHGDTLTPYDKAHFITYARLLDAEAEGADWCEVSRIVLHRDPDAEPDRTRRCWETHMTRAHWMVERGYKELVGGK